MCRDGGSAGGGVLSPVFSSRTVPPCSRLLTPLRFCNLVWFGFTCSPWRGKAPSRRKGLIARQYL